jgi:pectate lyase
MKSSNLNCAHSENTGEIWLNNITVIDGSTGIYFGKCFHYMLNGIKGRNQHGPWPKGQFVELSHSSYGSLTNFYNYNDPKNSNPQDQVNIWQGDYPLDTRMPL